tara:strand:+ start:11060 stop:11329 length:270 start_codon:yes stop_codon:yes gene_type:complete
MHNRNLDFGEIPIEFKQDYLNIDGTVALSAEGTLFKVGDSVCHEGSAVKGDVATIDKFTVDKESYDVIAHTEKGHGRIVFMYHPETVLT